MEKTATPMRSPFIKFIRSEYLYLFVVICLLFLIGEEIGLRTLKAQTQAITMLSDPFPHFQESLYPQLAHVYTPQISAQAALILDVSSRVVVFSKNPFLRFPPASTTKIMTALTALDYFKPEDILTAYDPTVVPVVLGLSKNEKMTFQNLLYAMLLPSANDAAVVIAQNFPGGEKAFVRKMNEKVDLFRLYDTHYADPVGLNDDQDYTTVHDLAIIASFAIEHPVLSKIVATKYATISSTSGKEYKLENLNKLLGQYGVNGIKTGYTEEAGEVLVTSARMNNNHEYVFVVMKSNDRFVDTLTLLQLIQNNVSYSTIHP